MKNKRKVHKFTHTTLAPTGISSEYEKRIPIKKHTTLITADVIITLLKNLQTRIALSAGKIIRLEIKSEPIIVIPRTIVSAVKIAISIL